MKDKSILKTEYIDIYKILPHNELKYYIESFLINNNEFIKDVDLCLCNGKMANMNLSEKMEYFNCNIGNEARTYLLKLLTLKHLSKILFNNIDNFTDKYWREQLNKVNF